MAGLAATTQHGRGGFNYARYTSAFTQRVVIVSLLNPAANTGDAAGDSYVNIEGLWGSSFNALRSLVAVIATISTVRAAQTFSYGQGGFDTRVTFHRTLG